MSPFIVSEPFYDPLLIEIPIRNDRASHTLQIAVRNMFAVHYRTTKLLFACALAWSRQRSVLLIYNVDSTHRLRINGYVEYALCMF